MKPLSKDVENIKEESKHELRIEIAEKCILQNASVNFIMNVCSLSRVEVMAIYNDLKQIHPQATHLETKETKTKTETFLEKNEQLKEERRSYKKEIKYLEAKKATEYRERREREAEQHRKIAAENTRVLMEKIKEAKNNNRLLEIEQLDLKEQELEKKQKIKETKEVKTAQKKVVKLEDPNILSAEQKMINSVGKCYLRGLTIDQAVIFSKVDREDIKRIYNSFKNK